MNYDGYDITMCSNEYCTKREQCHRFLTYQGHKHDKNEDKPILVSMLINEQAEPFDGCNLFWQHNDDK